MSATRLFDAGFTDLVCIVPPGATLSPNSRLNPAMLGKVPGKRGANGWYGYNFISRDERPTREDVQKWETWGANIGILGSRFPGLDIDSDSETLTGLVMSVAEKVLGQGPLRLSRGARRLIMYRTNEPFSLIRMTMAFRGKEYAVEFLGEGRQYLIAGTHPSGAKYRWSGVPLWEQTPDDPPLVNRARALDFFRILKTGLEDRLPDAVITLTGDGVVRDVSEEAQEGLRAPSDGELRHVVERIPNDGRYPSRDDYIKMGHAIKAASHGTGTGFSIWWEWCSRWPGNDRSPQGNLRAVAEEDWERMQPPYRVGWTWLVEQARVALGQGAPTTAVDEFEAVEVPPEPAATPEPAPEPEHFISWDAWRANPPPPARWLIDGILEAGTKGYLFGDPGVSKSWTAYDMALRLAAGQGMVLGRSVVAPCAVYFVRGEGMSRDTFRCITKLEACMDEHDLDNRLVIDHRSYDLTRTEGAKALYAQVRMAKHKHGWLSLPIVVIIDPFAEFLGGGDDSDVIAVKATQASVDNIRRGLGDDTTFVILHHPRKQTQGPGADKMPSLRGRSEIRAWADWAIGMQKLHEAEKIEEDGERSLEVLARIYSDKARSIGWQPLIQKLTVMENMACLSLEADTILDDLQQAQDAVRVEAAATHLQLLLVGRQGEVFSLRALRDLSKGKKELRDAARTLLVERGMLEEQQANGRARAFVVTNKIGEGLDGEAD